VVVKKSGYKKPRGFSLLPFHLFGRHYTYLSRSVRNQIDRAPVLRERWRFIIVHNSGTRQGNAHIFDYYHRRVRRMRNGLAYHFVIGNGTSSGNGEIEVGDRWRRQINGGHVHSDYLNNISLGICLVGDFNRDQPTRAQLDACEELMGALRQGGTAGNPGATASGDEPAALANRLSRGRISLSLVWAISLGRNQASSGRAGLVRPARQAGSLPGRLQVRYLSPFAQEPGRPYRCAP
jgi:hypothetical protein